MKKRKIALWRLRSSIDHEMYYHVIVNGEFHKKMNYTYCRDVDTKGHVDTYADCGYSVLMSGACMI